MQLSQKMSPEVVRWTMLSAPISAPQLGQWGNGRGSGANGLSRQGLPVTGLYIFAPDGHGDRLADGLDGDSDLGKALGGVVSFAARI